MSRGLGGVGAQVRLVERGTPAAGRRQRSCRIRHHRHGALEELGEVFEAQAQGDVGHVPLALLGGQADCASQFRQRRALLARPAHDFEAAARAHHRQVVADEPEREIVGEKVRPGQQHQQAGQDEADRVDGEPEPVTVAVAAELSAQSSRGAGFRDVVREEEPGIALLAHVPEQPLLSNALGHPAHHARFRPRQPPRVATGARTLAALPLGLRQHVREAAPELLQDPLRRIAARLRLRFVRHLAVQLIPVRANRYQITSMPASTIASGAWFVVPLLRCRACGHGAPARARDPDRRHRVAGAADPRAARVQRRGGRHQPDPGGRASCRRPHEPRRPAGCRPSPLAAEVPQGIYDVR